MYGAIVIEAADEKIHIEQDKVFVLSDWTDQNPMALLSKLKTQSDYYNYNQPTVIDFFSDIGKSGLSKAMAKRKMWNEMRMSPTDLADFSSTALTW